MYSGNGEVEEHTPENIVFWHKTHLVPNYEQSNFNKGSEYPAQSRQTVLILF